MRHGFTHQIQINFAGTRANGMQTVVDATSSTVEDNQSQIITYRPNQIFLRQNKFRFEIRELKNVRKTYIKY